MACIVISPTLGKCYSLHRQLCEASICLNYFEWNWFCWKWNQLDEKQFKANLLIMINEVSFRDYENPSAVLHTPGRRFPLHTFISQSQSSGICSYILTNFFLPSRQDSCFVFQLRALAQCTLNNPSTISLLFSFFLLSSRPPIMERALSRTTRKIDFSRFTTGLWLSTL